MPRQARQRSEYLHIIVRGVGKQILFEEDSDRLKYLEFLKKFQEETRISILSYCLMENHVHLLIRDTEDATPVFMKKMGVCYAQYYNWKYGRTGHLFQGRYKSEAVDDDSYLLSVFRYILNNPQKAGICAAKDYRWSNFHEYGKSDGLTDTKMLYEMIGDKDEFLEFLEQPDNVKCMEEHPSRNSDALAIDVLRKTLSVKSGTQLQQYDRKTRDEALSLLKKKGISVRQLERITGINRGVIQRAK